MDTSAARLLYRRKAWCRKVSMRLGESVSSNWDRSRSVRSPSCLLLPEQNLVKVPRASFDPLRTLLYQLRRLLGVATGQGRGCAASCLR
jgi:hypothetical protein